MAELNVPDRIFFEGVDAFDNDADLTLPDRKNRERTHL